METHTHNRSQLVSLKAKVKGLAEEGLRTRKFIDSTKGERRDYYWKVKRSIGVEARYHLIAYGLLRGLSYKQIEPNSNPANLIYFDYGYLALIMQHHCYHYSDKLVWTKDNIKRLITTGSITIPIKAAS